MLHADITAKILLAFRETYMELGCGFLESVYESALAIVLAEHGLEVQRQPPFEVHFRDRVIGEFRPDLVVEGLVLLELKCCRAIAPEHVAQVLNYLRASSIEVGFVLNFGPRPQFRRFVFANERKRLRRGPAVRLPAA